MDVSILFRIAFFLGVALVAKKLWQGTTSPTARAATLGLLFLLLFSWFWGSRS